MTSIIQRRFFVKSLMAVPALATGQLTLNGADVVSNNKQEKDGSRLKVSLNAYSFNDPLRNGSLTLDGLLEFCELHAFDAVDLTGYYFPGYPEVPPDDYIYKLKRKAFRLGLEISGTGIRNDFTDPDENKRKADVILVKKWIEAAAKLGAPVLRIFSGTQSPSGFSWDQIAKWMVKDMRECVEHGAKHGVIVAVQNHNDFIKTASHAQTILKMVDSDWFGLVLDIGSYRSGDPYSQISQTAPYAVNWQIKENMYVNGKEQKTNLPEIIRLIKLSGYHGYLPIETLGSGEPAIKVPLFLQEVRTALAGSKL